MNEKYIESFFEKNASEFKIDKKDGVFIPIEIRMNLQDFKKAIAEIVENSSLAIVSNQSELVCDYCGHKEPDLMGFVLTCNNCVKKQTGGQ